MISCNRTDSEDGQAFVARVDDAFLYPSDIRQILPANVSSADSMEIVDRFVNSWIRKQVFLQEAKKGLAAEQLDFDRQIEEYRNSLIIFSYENELIREQLDTTVSENQLADFYEKNKDDFRLREDIVKADYVKLPLETPELNRFRRLFRSSDPDEVGLLEEYCIQNAASYFIDTDSWLLLSDLIREVPLRVSNSESFLRSNKWIEINDENFRYFVKILDYQLQGSVSPLAFERENIRSIIINQRKHELINQMRNQFYQDAVDRGHVEIRKID
ncbi:MAG: hypothetical protein V2I46_06455 [Bacteroides sp.]|jgi:hypothetical protein|nr:hypothetical protein [Bacteroides sp.]